MSTEDLSGSCLCGNVRYTASGETLRFYHCHCSRCRKASGAAHASNMFVKGRLQWQSGEELIAVYKVPEAQRFTVAFCRNCGSRVPRYIDKIGMAFIPAGSLDVEPAASPQARVFTGSRAAWSCDATEMPEFSEFPA
ncbi:MAG TPA: GFA family protein [Burkholderiales bacterium]|nr:GFA family protein [Burkholderiales bacterium]